MQELAILKTYKIFIGGSFPRTESGRYYKLINSKKEVIANMCLCSRKDVRNAVVAARKAFEGWSGRAAFNRGQILYRIAEMLEGRKSQFVDELIQQGVSKVVAEKEVRLTIERCVYYSGWCDKYTQVFSAVNPVASSHFNFSVPEPMGVITVLANEDSSLLGLVSIILPIIAGGNTCVVLASEQKPLCAITLAEVLATSDLPGGVVNILTGKRKELLSHLASHLDVNAVVYSGNSSEEWEKVNELASINVKRSFKWNHEWASAESANPYLIMDVQEIKTTWHPIENIGVTGVKY